MKLSTIAEAVVLNVVLVSALYWVILEQANRAGYAAQEGLAFLFARFPLSFTTTLSGRNGQLTSPLTLDWVQAIVLALVILDLIYVYGIVRPRSAQARSPPEADLRASA
ncbi:MAG: hypothetical protein LYZ69_00580 [Nitrososphaerales archaeon]|nr:hypothetical protein [Nitrososphaerales archaeon]